MIIILMPIIKIIVMNAQNFITRNQANFGRIMILPNCFVHFFNQLIFDFL